MKRILPFTLALALLLTGCGGPAGGTQDPGPASPTPGGGSSPPNPTPPDISAVPPSPVRYTHDAYALARVVYPERADCDPALVRGNQNLLNFAAKSTPLALAGHEGENAIYSPVSLWFALATAARCAAGESRIQVLSALGVGDVDPLAELVRQVWLSLYTNDGRDSLTLGNSVWLNSAAEGSYVSGTLDALSKDYFSEVYSVPMGTAEADRAITAWISEQTHGLIGGDDPVVETDALTLAVLASSLYYRAGWTDEFFAQNTWEDTFTAADGQESRVDFMHADRKGLFLLRDGYQAAYLPTRLGEMVFVLPDEGVTPESLLDDPDFLSSLQFSGSDAHRGEVQWSVPKFDVNSGLDLMDALKALGITDLIDPDKSDFSNLTDIPAYLSKALQLARVKVDEEGVEAAAVTIMMWDLMAAMPTEDPEICVMDLDRPFLFVVRSQDLPLFVGVVNQVG